MVTSVMIRVNSDTRDILNRLAGQESVGVFLARIAEALAEGKSLENVRTALTIADLKQAVDDLDGKMRALFSHEFAERYRQDQRISALEMLTDKANENNPNYRDWMGDIQDNLAAKAQHDRATGIHPSQDTNKARDNFLALPDFNDAMTDENTGENK